MENKKCNDCTKIKLATEFHVDFDQKSKKSFRMELCKVCFQKKYNKTFSYAYQAILRQRVVDHLGGCCAWCGFDDPRALQIDHIFGDGGKERRGKKNWSQMYREILEGEREHYFQILCANCNFIKRHKYDKRKLH